MLNLILLIIASIYNLALGFFWINYQRNKCLGMQTLYDQALVNGIQCSMLCMISSVFMSSIATFTDSTWNHFLATLITLPCYVIAVNVILSLASVAALRYLIVFHGTVFYRIEDDKVISIVRASNLIVSSIMVSYEYVISESLSHLYYFGVLTDTFSSSGGYLISIRISNFIGNVQF